MPVVCIPSVINLFIQKMWEQNLSEHKDGSISVPLPSAVTGSEDEVRFNKERKNTAVFYTRPFSCESCDGKGMMNLNASESYQYLHSEKVSPVWLKEVTENLVYLKVEPSQSLKKMHHKEWVKVSETGVIQTAGCSCI